MDINSAMFRVDKSAFSIVSLHDESDEKEFWRTKTCYERLQAIELQRQVIYGYKPAAVRFQRLLEIAQLKTS